MKGSTANTMGESLQKLLGDIAQMQAMPDADMEFLTNLQQTVVGKIRSMLQGPGQGQQQPGQPDQSGGQPGGQPDAQGLMAALGGGATPGGPSPMGGPMPGLSATGGTANMDELSRLLGGASRTG